MKTNNNRLKNLAFRLDGNQSMETETLRTTNEAAKFLKISEVYLRYLTSKGQIPHFKIGRQNRYRMRDLIKLIKPGNQGG